MWYNHCNMGRSTYTDDVKARGVALYLEHGAAEAARILTNELGRNVPSGTIASWASRGDIASERHANNLDRVECARVSREAKREQLREKILDKALDMLGRMDEPHHDYRGKDADRVTWEKAPADACKAYATSCAILVDKFRLEMGESTGRQAVEHVGAEKAHGLVDELEARRARNAA